MKVTGKVWVVTGAGSGIGRELVLRLLAGGGRVAAVDRNAEALAEVAGAAAAGERLSTHVLDITDRVAVDALPAQVQALHNAVDGVINNAGIIQPFVPVAELDDATVERVMGINFFGTLSMTRAFLPLLLARPEAHLVNVASMAGFFPFPGQTIYGASKAAVKLLTEGLYAELLDTSVRVSVVLPGAIDTAITQNSGLDLPDPDADGPQARMTSAPDAARMIVAGIEKDRLHVYVGKDSRLMSLAVKVAPRPAIRLVKKAMGKHADAMAAKDGATSSPEDLTRKG